MGNILVCDDERSICEMLDIALRRDGHKVETVKSGEDAKRKLDSALYDVVVTDIKMPNTDGIEVLRYAHQVSPDSAVILITAVDDYEAAVQAVKAGGATDYIRKSPGLVDEIKLAINRALEKMTLSRQNFAFKRDAATRNSLDNIVGVSPAMEKLKQTIRTVASTQSTILIYGESGTGKELVARAVHVCSPRAGEPVRLHQLRRLPGNSAGKRIVWLRKRRIHGRQPEQARTVRSCRPGHDLSRRNQRDDADHAGQTAACAAGAQRASGGRHHRDSHRRAGHCRHQPRSRQAGGGKYLSRRPCTTA